MEDSEIIILKFCKQKISVNIIFHDILLNKTTDK